MEREDLWQKRWNALKNYMTEQSEAACDPGHDDILSFDEVIYVMEQIEELKENE